MRFGVCCQLQQAAQVLSAGFDYVELPAGASFAGPGEPDWQLLSDVHVEATNLFVAGDLKMVGPERGDIRGYAERVISRAARAGVKVMVIGSGGARKSPAGFDLDQAEDEFVQAAAWCQEIATPLGVTIAPESLVPEETNVGNYLGDFARLLARKGVAYTADSYHVLNQPGNSPGEPGYWEAELPFLPAHVHLGDRPRNWPKRDDPEILGFSARLMELGYEGRISLECRWENFEEELSRALDEVKVIFGI